MARWTCDPAAGRLTRTLAAGWTDHVASRSARAVWRPLRMIRRSLADQTAAASNPVAPEAAPGFGDAAAAASFAVLRDHVVAWQRRLNGDAAAAATVATATATDRSPATVRVLGHASAVVTDWLRASLSIRPTGPAAATAACDVAAVASDVARLSRRAMDQLAAADLVVLALRPADVLAAAAAQADTAPWSGVMDAGRDLVAVVVHDGPLSASEREAATATLQRSLKRDTQSFVVQHVVRPAGADGPAGCGTPWDPSELHHFRDQLARRLTSDEAAVATDVRRRQLARLRDEIHRLVAQQQQHDQTLVALKAAAQSLLSGVPATLEPDQPAGEAGEAGAYSEAAFASDVAPILTTALTAQTEAVALLRKKRLTHVLLSPYRLVKEIQHKASPYVYVERHEPFLAFAAGRLHQSVATRHMQLLQAMTALRARAAQNVVHDALAPRAANPPVAARAACDAVDAAIEQIAALDPRHAPFADPFHFGPHLERYDADVEQRLASFQATTLRLMQSYVAGLGASALLLPAVLAAGVSVATALPVAALTAAAVTAAARWRWLRAIRRLDSRLCRHRAALEHDLVADYRRLGASHWSQPSHIAISELITSLDAQLAETRLTIEQLQQLAHATTR